MINNKKIIREQFPPLSGVPHPAGPAPPFPPRGGHGGDGMVHGGAAAALDCGPVLVPRACTLVEQLGHVHAGDQTLL